jgi:hypothetical protein
MTRYMTVNRGLLTPARLMVAALFDREEVPIVLTAKVTSRKRRCPSP